ncbi:MAG: response regulator [Rhodospirillales bacterium]
MSSTVKYQVGSAGRIIVEGGVELASYNLRKLSAIIVEKNGLSMNMERGIMTRLGIGDLRTATDTDRALEMFRQRQPDMIFSDWAPGLDGIRFLRAVRNGSNSPNPFVPFVMISANTERHHICKARDSGMSEFLAKPFTATLIYSRICRVIERAPLFVSTPNFFGPNRRRRKLEVLGRERRLERKLKVVDCRNKQVPFNWPESRASDPGHNPAEARRIQRV